MTKILIIEDHKEMRDVLVGPVELMGFKAVAAISADDGIKSALAEEPDLILVDLKRPKVDGLKITQMLRAHPKTGATPILVASGLAGGSDVEICMQAGCTGYIAKPFIYDELRIKICRLLGSSNIGP